MRAAPLALLLAVQTAGSAPAETLALERVLDGRGRPIATVARLERREGDARVAVRLVRGLGEDDLVLRERVTPPSGRVREVWLADRAALRLGEMADGRLEAHGGERTLRFFEEDGATRTVRCGLLTLAEGVDARLVPAASSYARLKEELGETEWGGLDLPAALLRALVPSRPPAPATHRREPLPPDDPGREALAAAARAAAARK